VCSKILTGEKRAPHAACWRTDTDADGTRAELNQFEVLLCLPTAPVLPLKETETSVGLRFLGNSRTSYCWSFVYYVAVPDVKRKNRWRIKALNLHLATLPCRRLYPSSRLCRPARRCKPSVASLDSANIRWNASVMCGVVGKSWAPTGGINDRAPQYGALYAYAYITLVRRQPTAVDWGPQAP